MKIDEIKFVATVVTFAAIMHLIVGILFKFATEFMTKLVSYMCFGIQPTIVAQTWGALILGLIAKVIIVAIIAFVFAKIWNTIEEKM